jgi:hypothetical protein
MVEPEDQNCHNLRENHGKSGWRWTRGWIEAKSLSGGFSQ